MLVSRETGKCLDAEFYGDPKRLFHVKHSFSRFGEYTVQKSLFHVKQANASMPTFEEIQKGCST
jgi:hypothetical protein